MQRFWILAVATAFAVGCDGGGGGGGAGAPSTAPSLPLAASTIDTQGGTAKINDPSSGYDGTSVTIPAGALTQPTTITINAAQSLPLGTLPVELEPSGTIFTTPVTLTLPYPATLLQELGKSDDAKDLMVISQDVDENVEVHPTQKIGTNFVDTTTTHFTIFEVLFPRHYKWFRQPYRFIDETPELYDIGITNLKGSAPFITTEYSPVLARGPSNRTVVLGKGTVADFFASSQGNVLLIHGFLSSPTVFYFDEQVRVNDNDLSLSLRNASAFNGLFRNVILYQYRSGWTIASNAEKFDALMRKNAKPGFKTTIIAHSMGGLVARYAIETLDLSQYVDKLITTGTPHEGGQLNYFADYYADSGFLYLPTKIIPGLHDLLPGNSFFKPLIGKGINERFPDHKLPATEYYLIAGKKTGVGDDGLVTVGSATSTFLNVPITHQHIVDNVTHWELHGNAKRNGVLMKIREWVTGQPNRAPVADAGADQTVNVSTQVTLTGSATDPDLDTFTYVWTQTAGATVTLSSTTTVTATFTPTQTGVYTFTLTANDTAATGTDTVTITVNPLPPPPAQTQVFGTTYDTYTTSNAQYNTTFNFSTFPGIVVGNSGSTQFWGTIVFNTVTQTIPANATIISAELSLGVRMKWTDGTVAVAGGGQTVATMDTRIATSANVKSYVQTVVAAGGVCTFELSSGSAYIEYHSSEGTGYGPTLTIKWQ